MHGRSKPPAHSFRRREVTRLRVFLISTAILVAISASAQAAGRRVVYVDNSRSEEGDGSADHPFKRLASAERHSLPSDIIYVAETPAPYQDGIALKQGQMLIGSAYGLEAERADFHIEIDAPIIAAIRGPGPAITGTVQLSGDNLVAGCTIITRQMPGIASTSATGPLTIRNVWFRPSRESIGIAIDD